MKQEELKSIIREKAKSSSGMFLINTQFTAQRYNIDEKRVREAFADLCVEEIVFLPANIDHNPNYYFLYRDGSDDEALEKYLKTELKRLKTEYRKRINPLKKFVKSETLINKLGHLTLAFEGEENE